MMDFSDYINIAAIILAPIVSVIIGQKLQDRARKRDDKVIFISIDDGEVENLRKICDEAFGDTNFIADLIWQKKFSRSNDAIYFSTMHDQILCYCKKFDGAGVFDGSKPMRLLTLLLTIANLKDGDIALDFFSGSATTAHAVMQLNAEDGGHRKFIMVQLPEPCDEKSEAYKAGYPNICEIGKERIRRTGLDLLFGCLLEWGLPISMPYTSGQIEGCTIHTYNDGDLIACFDANIPDTVIKEIAKRQPLRAVFRDSSFANSSAKINVGEIFKMLASNFRVKVL